MSIFRLRDRFELCDSGAECKLTCEVRRLISVCEVWLITAMIDRRSSQFDVTALLLLVPL